jgi:hypothetical protein
MIVALALCCKCESTQHILYMTALSLLYLIYSCFVVASFNLGSYNCTQLKAWLLASWVEFKVTCGADC